jgi:hypothetical protein
MLNTSMINTTIQSAKITKEVNLKCFSDIAHVKKFSRKDSIAFSEEGIDMVNVMILKGIVDDKGAQIFESIEQIEGLPSTHTTELFNHVNEYNSITVEDQAKK